MTKESRTFIAAAQAVIDSLKSENAELKGKIADLRQEVARLRMLRKSAHKEAVTA